MSKTVVPMSAEQVDQANLFASRIVREYIHARMKFGPFSNGHEGLAVIWEEFEELKSFVFGKNQSPAQVHDAGNECIQIAAMALAFYIELLS